MTTRFSMPCDRGDVVIVRIRFTDGEGTKKRPAVIVSGEDYHESRSDAVMVALSTQRAVPYFGDCDLLEWRQAGLPQPTKAKGVIQTIDRSTIETRLGALSSGDYARVQDSIRGILGLR